MNKQIFNTWKQGWLIIVFFVFAISQPHAQNRFLDIDNVDYRLYGSGAVFTDGGGFNNSFYTETYEVTYFHGGLSDHNVTWYCQNCEFLNPDGSTTPNNTLKRYSNTAEPSTIEVVWDASELTHSIIAEIFIGPLGNDVFDAYLEADITAPNAPDAPTVSNYPGYTRITRGDPTDEDETWYWQESSSAVATANNSQFINRTSVSPLYLRAYNDFTGLWSDKTYVGYTVDPAPPEPETILSDENYVYTVTPISQDGTLDISTLSNDEKIETVAYFDGLGRPMQNIGIRAGGNREDILAHTGYDSFGRQAKDYLPYAASGNWGAFVFGAEEGTKNYYYSSNNFNVDFPGMTESEVNPFSEKHLEASPLSRVLEQGAPGADWEVDKNSDADHTIKFEYGTNTNFDYVRQFRVNLSSGVPVLEEDNNAYSPGELFKTITKDENWQPGQEFHQEHTTEEYKDKLGRVVLKRTFDQQKWLSTYYVYDDYGNLTYVLSPKAGSINANENTYSGIEEWGDYTFIMGTSEGFSVNIGLYNVSSGQVLSSGLFEDFNMSPQIPDMVLGYFMGRDSSGNPAPAALVYFQNGDIYFDSTGVGLEPNAYGEADFAASVDMSNYIANDIDTSTLNGLCYQYRYDDRNRLIGKRIPGKDWEYIVYDNLDRPVLTQDGNQRKINNPALTTDQWLFTKYDVFGRVAYTGIFESDDTRDYIQSNKFDNKTAAQNYEERVPLGTGSGYNGSYYTNQYYPTSGLEILTINYYDDYGFYGPSLPTSALGQDIVNNDDSDRLKTRGLATGAKVKVLGEPNWITTVTGYDKKGRAVYVKSENGYLNTADIVENKLDFTGKVLETKTRHEKTGKAPIETFDHFTYDHMGRLISQKQNIGGQGDELIVLNNYDELGQLESKKVGGAASANIEGSSGLQTVDYKYNVRGWLKQINNPAALGADLFAFKINYNTVDHHSSSMLPDVGVPLYNGNISETEWRTANEDNSLRWYRYEYDALNRITFALDNAVHYTLYNVAYDKNGNLSTLGRYGLKEDTGNVYGGMDNLKYTYEADSNKLLGVRDYASSSYKAYGFNDGNNSSYDYGYDANGNMTSDGNKGIAAITYNHLNLPDEVQFGGTDKIKYIYDATGAKLEKKVTENGSDTYTHYAGNYVYRDTGSGSSLKFFNHPEGYIEPEDANNYSQGFNYAYQYRDHLGNVRLSYMDTNRDGNVDGTGSTSHNDEILEENNYYPFGLKHKGYNEIPTSFANTALKWKYNNTEYEKALGLNLYEMPFRSYDPAIARWTTIDPVTHHSQSTYNGYDNNPVFWADPSGADVIDGVFTTTYDGVDAQNLFRQLQAQNGGSNYNFSNYVTNNDKDYKEEDDEHRRKRKKGKWQLYFGYKKKEFESEYGLNTSGVPDDSSLRYIPMYGSSLDAEDAFGRGDVWTGLGHTLLGASDVFLVKSLFFGLGKAMVKKGISGGLKRYFGIGMSHNYGATVSRLKGLGVNVSGYKHHWLISQKWMERYTWLKPIGNQTWNFTRFSTQAAHMRWAHGQMFKGVKYPFTFYLYPATSTPLWFRSMSIYGAKNMNR